MGSAPGVLGGDGAEGWAARGANNSAVIHERALVSLIVLALGLPW